MVSNSSPSSSVFVTRLVIRSIACHHSLSSIFFDRISFVKFVRLDRSLLSVRLKIGYRLSGRPVQLSSDADRLRGCPGDDTPRHCGETSPDGLGVDR